MLGASAGNLRLRIQNPTADTLTRVWSRTATASEKSIWQTVSVGLGELDAGCRVMFDAMPSPGYGKYDIAIDDVTFTDCQPGGSSQTPLVGPPSTTPKVTQPPSNCGDGLFACDGSCISAFLVCDGIKDCHDNADETSCTTCAQGTYHCVWTSSCLSSTTICNGAVDCKHQQSDVKGYDEAVCGACPAKYCQNGGTCVPVTSSTPKCNCISGHQGSRCQTPPMTSQMSSSLPPQTSKSPAVTNKSPALPTRSSPLTSKSPALPTRKSPLTTKSPVLPTRSSPLTSKSTSLSTKSSPLTSKSPALMSNSPKVFATDTPPVQSNPTQAAQSRSSDTKKWAIPVGVILSLLVIAAAVLIGAFMYRRHRLRGVAFNTGSMSTGLTNPVYDYGSGEDMAHLSELEYEGRITFGVSATSAEKPLYSEA